MSAFLIVVIIVAVLGIALALTRWFRPTRAMEQIGRRGPGTLAGGQDDSAARERPGRPHADEPEGRVPARPLRARPD
jgi:hypothetical protein